MSGDKVPDFKIPSIRPWRELSLIALMVMELCWVVPWFRSLTRATYAVPPAKAFLVLAGIMLGFNWIVRFMNFVNLRMSIRRVFLLILSVVSVLVALKALLYARQPLSLVELLKQPLGAFSELTSLIPDEFLVALIALYVFYRGMMMAQTYIEPATLRRSFLLGIGMFVAFIFINTIATGETPGGLIYVFFLAALIGMTAARISVISSLRGGGSNPFDRQWFITMVASAMVVIGLAAGLGALFGGRLAVFGQVGSMILGLFALIMVAIISPLIYAAQTFLSSSHSATQTLQGLVNALQNLRVTLFEFSGKIFGFFDQSGIFDWVSRLKSILLWSALLVASLVILASLTQWLLKERDSRKDERQSLATGGDLLKLIQQALQRRLKNLGDGLMRAATLGRGQRFLAAMRIRRIYTQLMDLSEMLGKTRAPAETPLEFLPTLDGLFTGMESELNAITAAYLRVRYGEFPETRQEIDSVEAAWEGVRLQGQKQLKLKQK